MKRAGMILAFVLVVVAATLIVQGMNRREAVKGASDPGSLLNAVAPDFTLTDLTGKDVVLSGLKGKVVLVNFWASWCPPCIMEIPSLSSFAETYRGQGVEVLAINVENIKVDQLQDFLQQHPHAFQTLLDPSKRVQNRYGVRRLPETFLIDREGVVMKRYIGARDWMGDDVARTVDFLLGG